MQDYLSTFLENNKAKLAPDYCADMQKCKVYTPSDDDLQKLGAKIRDGELVAFPTNTVYGLGADATNESAIRSIYAAKGRPLTDPVIVHINSMDMIDKIVDKKNTDMELLNFLGKNLWPGPVTFIVPANLDYIPSVVTADTGFVGIRFPQNEIARKLIEYAKTPICAPSANKFAHVSPTSGIHVFNDLYDQELSLIDGPSAIYGLESTVVKISNEGGERSLLVLRHGSISTSKLQQLLRTCPSLSSVKLFEKNVESSSSIIKNAEAPGQLLKHYCPRIPTYLLNRHAGSSPDQNFDVELGKTVLIDFNNAYKDLHFEGDLLCRLDLSKTGHVEEAMFNFYAFLRDAELMEGAECILLIGKQDFMDNMSRGREFFNAMFDKMFRSASGNCVFVKKEYTNSTQDGIQFFV